MKHLLYTLPLLLLAACSGEKGTPVSGNEKSVPADTLTINGRLFELDSITESFFNAVASTAPVIPQDEKEKILPADAANVKRTDSVLIFTTPGKTVRLVNRYETGDSYFENATYRYVANLTSMKQWFVEVFLHEGYYCLLIDQRTGEQTEIWAKPVISPDQKHFATCSADLEAGFIANGMQLFEISDKGVSKIWEREISKWAPDDIRWKNDSTLLIMKSVMDSVGYKYSYRKMVVL